MKASSLLGLSAVIVACSQPTTPCPIAPVASSAAAAATAKRAPDVDPTGNWSVRWDRKLAGWKPAVFDGTLKISRAGDQLGATLAFDQSVMKPVFKSASIDGTRVHLVFDTAAKEDGSGHADLEIVVDVRDDRLVGEMHTNRVPWSPFSGKRSEPFTLADGHVDHSLASADLSALPGLDRAALAKLVERAIEEKSTAIVVLKDGKIAVERYRAKFDGGPVMAMSATKSITSLAVGLLIADKKLSLDTTMAQIFPDWKKLGAKSAITIRQLLSHTSGLDPARASGTGITIRKHTLDAKLVFKPGTRFQYNNAAVDFLAVVVRDVAGMPLDEFLERRIFSKLDFVAAKWMKDEEGNPLAAGELSLRPVDLAKIGQLMLDGGRWNGEQLVPREWITQSTAPAQSYSEDCGLLWWREGSFDRALTQPVLDGWIDAGVDAKRLAPLRPMLGKRYSQNDALRADLEQGIGGEALADLDRIVMKADHLVGSARLASGPATGYSARGWLGQYLVVYPDKKLVGVRMRISTDTDAGRGDADSYGDFAERLAKLF